MTKPKFQFPKHFFWGASTSAHQVEGNNHNQWTVWELENAQGLAKAAPYRLEHLESWSRIRAEAERADNYVSGEAADHYNRYEQDFDAVKAMGLNAFRFSIEWSRLEPKEGSWDVREIEHYRQYIKALRQRGIEPFVTLYHWTEPTWFSDKGGFEKLSNIKYFVRFAEKVIDELGVDIKYITTINEPDTVMMQGYFLAQHPPQKHSPLLGIHVYFNLLRAHKRVYKLARKRSRRFKVGFTKAYAWVSADQHSWRERLMVRLDFLIRDDIPLWFVGRKTAYIGLNYYFSDKRQGFKMVDHSEATPRSDLGWEMVPEDLEKVLRRLGDRHPKLPIVITESGVADARDEYRQWWTARSLAAIHAAIVAGVRVDGYLHWALLDNFEWAYGKWPRFGLIEVDYDSQQRKPRPSALWYAKVVKNQRSGS